jgi:hypothetical protein
MIHPVILSDSEESCLGFIKILLRLMANQDDSLIELKIKP